MVMIYKGFGWLVWVIWILLIVAGAKISDILYNDLDWGFILVFAGLMTAPIIGGGGYYLNKKNPFVLKEFSPTGITEKFLPRHTLYSIRIEYWGIIIPVLTLCFYLYLYFRL